MEEKFYVQMRQEFYRKYQTVIVPVTQKYDNERKIRLVLAILGKISTCLFVLWGLWCIFGSGNDDKTVPFILIIWLFGWFSWHGLKKGFENKIKKLIMPIVCSCFDDMKWYEGSYTGDELFKASSLVPICTSFYYDDVFLTRYKDVNIDIVEAVCRDGSSSSGFLVFDGVIVKLDMNKKFNSNTVIKPDTLSHKSPSEDLRYTVLEDVVFEKKYDVFTNDEVDARYLITPSFMERLNNMKVAFSADKVSCAFYNNYLLVALHTRKDVFSISSLVKPVDDAKQYFTMYEEIVSIMKLIDHFKLDQKIGL